MSATQQFIADAIKGGWLPEGCDGDDTQASDYGLHVMWFRGDGEIAEQHLYSVKEILIDPLAWQAVGKTRGWEGQMGRVDKHLRQHWIEKIARQKQHDFIDLLIDGKTIEEASLAINPRL